VTRAFVFREPEDESYRCGTGATLDQILGLLHEYAEIAVYWRKGWV
jgi:hypothetical protein